MTLEHCSQTCAHMSLCGALLPAPGILRQGSSDSNVVLLLVYVPLEKEMATQNSSILAWEILWTEEPNGRPRFNPWVGKIPGEGKGYPLQYSGLENSMDCIVHSCEELDRTV